MKVTNTQDYKLRGVKCLTYGEAGVGKTTLCSTAPAPIILSAESGLLSLADHDIDVIEIEALKDLAEAYVWCSESEEAEKYQTICVDSLSDISEKILGEKLGKFKDPRQAYGEMATEMAKAVRKFRDLHGRHVYFSAKVKRVTDDATGITNFMPSVPGQVLLQDLPFFFDEVFAMQYKKVEKKMTRYLQTEGDLRFVAKDRSGKLNPAEKPNLTTIFDKIMKGTKNGATSEQS